MRKTLYTIMLILLVVIAACRKSDNATMPDGIVYLNQPHITKVSGAAVIYDNDPMAFSAKIKIDFYFKNSKKPENSDLVVIKNGDTKNPKVIKAGINTFPTELEINGQLLTSLFGNIVSGDTFDIGLDMFENGTKYSAFSSIGTSYGSGVTSSQANSSPTIRYSSICGFEISEFLGDFKVKTDPWADFGEGEIVNVYKVSDNTIGIKHIAPNFEDLLVEINSEDNSAKISSKMIATESAVTGYYGGGGAYGSLTVVTSGSSAVNFVNPCSNSIHLNIQYTLSKFGNQGSFPFVLEKVN